MLFFTVIQLCAKCSYLRDQCSTSIPLISKWFQLSVHIPICLFLTVLSGCAAPLLLVVEKKELEAEKAQMA